MDASSSSSADSNPSPKPALIPDSTLDSNPVPAGPRFLRDLSVSLADRECDLRQILRCADDEDDSSALPLPASEVVDEWKTFLRGKVPDRNWLAVWDKQAMSSTVTTTEVAYVDVHEVIYENFTALVVILQCAEGSEIAEVGSEKMVSLLELYPILESDESDDETEEANIESLSIASVALDHCRFFFKYIWLPWDEDDDEADDWADEHLEHRMELYQEYKQLGEKSRNWAQMKLLEEEYKDLVEEISLWNADEHDESSTAAFMYRCEERQLQIRRKGMVIERADLRSAVNVLMQDERRKKREVPGNRINVVVPEAQCFARISTYLSRAEDMATSFNLPVKVFNSVQSAFDECILGDVVLLPTSSELYMINDLGEMEMGGHIIGIRQDDDDETQDEAKVFSKIKYDNEALENIDLVNASLVFKS